MVSFCMKHNFAVYIISSNMCVNCVLFLDLIKHLDGWCLSSWKRLLHCLGWLNDLNITGRIKEEKRWEN